VKRETGGDVVIVGAGLIGLALAFELARRGATVRVFDRAQPARGASWAGAGMLAPSSEAIAEGPLQTLCALSLRMYPAFVRAVHEASSVDAHLQLDGIVHAAFDDVHFAALRERSAALKTKDGGAETLDRMQVLALVPALSAAVVGGLVIRGEGQVDNRRLGRALIAGCERRGVRVYSDVAAMQVECDERRALGVRTDRGFVAANVVVNAAGARADAVEGVPEFARPRMRPVKGQMLALAIPSGFMRRVTWVPGAYFVPRGDGRLLVGATSEADTIDERVTAQGVHDLLHATLGAAPALRDFAVSETWAGIRPGTVDGKPYLGPTPLGRYFLATGHYRNGILLAPATAVLLADAIEGDAAACAPFALDRGGAGRDAAKVAAP
jgi:glycine oxidase